MARSMDSFGLARGQVHDRFGELAGVIDVGGVGLGEKLYGLSESGEPWNYADRPPVQAGRNLERGDTLRLRRIVPQRDFPRTLSAAGLAQCAS